MKIAIPSANGKLCAHFGHCENFTFVETEDNQIKSIQTSIPEDGISCQSAYWIAEKGADIVLAGGMGGRPMAIFEQSGVKVIAGCPELEIRTLVEAYLNSTLETGSNSCGGEHHQCHGHGEGHCHHV